MARRRASNSRPRQPRLQPARHSRPLPDRGAAATSSPAPGNDWAHGRRGLLTWSLLLAAILAFAAILKSYSLNPYAGDEFIYIYQAKLITEGEVPYRDFAMAHPPVQALVTGAMLKLFGSDLPTLRMLPVFWFLLAGALLAALVRRELGGTAGLLAALLYLTAHEPLRASSHLTGVNMTVALLIAAVLGYRTGRLRAAAALSVLAVFTRFYAVPGVAAMTAFALVADRRRGMALVRHGAIMGVAAILLIGAWTGFGAMAHDLVGYHAAKTPMAPDSLTDMKLKVLFHNATLATLFALSLAALCCTIGTRYVRRRGSVGRGSALRQAVTEGNAGLVILSAVMAGAMLLVLTAMDRVWMYYFIPSFPFAAVTGAWMTARLGSGAWRWIRARGRLAAAGLETRDVGLGLIAAALFAAAFAASPMLEANLDYYDKEMAKPPDRRVHTYAFPPSPLPDWIHAWTRHLLWQPERIIGEPYHAINYYLWHESRVFDVLDEIVDLIESETAPQDEIFGDSGTVPLFALVSGRRIAGSEVDTNIQRYRSGNADPEALMQKIDNDKTKMIILRHRFGVFGVKEVRRLVETKYRRLRSVRSAQGWVFHVFKRKTAKESPS